MGSRCWSQYDQTEKEAMLFLQEAILATPTGWGSAESVPETGLPESPPSGDTGSVAEKEPGLLEEAPDAGAFGIGEGSEGGAAGEGAAGEGAAGGDGAPSEPVGEWRRSAAASCYAPGAAGARRAALGLCACRVWGGGDGFSGLGAATGLAAGAKPCKTRYGLKSLIPCDLGSLSVTLRIKTRYGRKLLTNQGLRCLFLESWCKTR